MFQMFHVLIGGIPAQEAFKASFLFLGKMTSCVSVCLVFLLFISGDRNRTGMGEIIRVYSCYNVSKDKS